jgi:hypothetical protein
MNNPQEIAARYTALWNEPDPARRRESIRGCGRPMALKSSSTRPGKRALPPTSSCFANPASRSTATRLSRPALPARTKCS